MSIRKCLVILSSSLLLVPALCFAATTLKSMGKDDINKEFVDKTFTTISAATLNGSVISNTFTGYFSKDGKATGKFATKPADAPQTDTGTWKINGDDLLCVKWGNWDSGKERCVSFYKLNNGLLVINAQSGFESMILNKDIQSGNQM